MVTFHLQTLLPNSASTKFRECQISLFASYGHKTLSSRKLFSRVVVFLLIYFLEVSILLAMRYRVTSHFFSKYWKLTPPHEYEVVFLENGLGKCSRQRLWRPYTSNSEVQVGARLLFRFSYRILSLPNQGFAALI